MGEAQEVKAEVEKESYVPKMKPGDVEIPNRVFVKGFPREATADDLFTFFEEHGKVLECRIVADRYGYSKGYGFITFDSQNVAEKVKSMERMQYDDDIELAIGPARIRKKRFYLLPTPAYQQPQAYYGADGTIFWAQCIPQQQMMQPTAYPVQVLSNSPNNQNYGTPVSQQGYGTNCSPTYVTPVSQPYGTHIQQTYNSPMQPQQYNTSSMQQNYGTPIQQSYGTPVVLSVVNSDGPPPPPPNNQSSPCIYQTNPNQNMNSLVEKVSNLTISQSPMTVNDDAIVPSMNPSPTYVDIQPAMSGQETIVYNPVVSFVPQQRHM